MNAFRYQTDYQLPEWIPVHMRVRVFSFVIVVLLVVERIVVERVTTFLWHIARIPDPAYRSTSASFPPGVVMV